MGFNVSRSNALSLKNIIVFENQIPDGIQELASRAEISLYTFDQVLQKGKSQVAQGVATFDTPKPETIYFISYTSGTTGDPKGVKVSHKAALATLASI